MSLTLPIEMLQAANDLFKTKNKCDKIKIQLISDTLTPIQTKSGLLLQAESLLPDPDTVNDGIIFLPGLWRHPKRSLSKHASIVAWIQSLINLEKKTNKHATVCAAGTGVWYLAETGCLNHKPATTHWHYLDDFQKSFPEVQLKHQHLITQAGTLYCASSVNALADLTVHLIGQLFGSSISAHIERHFSHEARRPFENTSFLDHQASRHQDEEIIQAQLWLNQNLNKQIQLLDCAKDFDMSLRNFNRRFKAATGKTPLLYLQEIRVQNGRDLLKNSNLSIAEVAERVGYLDAAHFAQLFKRFTAMTPSAFRKSVRSKLFSL